MNKTEQNNFVKRAEFRGNSREIHENSPATNIYCGLTTLQIIIRIIAIIATSELLIMLGLEAFSHDLGAKVDTLIDVVLLMTVSTPLVYYWVVRPFVVARNNTLSHINHMAYHDALTGLANRRLLFYNLEKGISSCVRHGTYGALIFIDLDGFKPINDEYGHDAGDAILVEIAKRLNTASRTEDLVCRLGGDEFVFMALQLDSNEQTAKNKTLIIAHKIQKAILEPITFDGQEHHLGSSIGVTLVTTTEVEGGSDSIIKQADNAMYRVKEAGRGGIIFHNENKEEENAA